MDTTEKPTSKKKEYYKKNRERLIEYSKTWAANNKDRKKTSYDKFRTNRPEARLWIAAKSRSKRKGLEFNIEIEDIMIPENCPYLGIKLTNIINSGKLDTNPSLDRIDNSFGYVKGNIQVISNLANVMKNSATQEQLEYFARSILGLHT